MVKQWVKYRLNGPDGYSSWDYMLVEIDDPGDVDGDILIGNHIMKELNHTPLHRHHATGYMFRTYRSPIQIRRVKKPTKKWLIQKIATKETLMISMGCERDKFKNMLYDFYDGA